MQDEVIRETLYGSESSNTCAYCCKHYKALTPRQMHTKGCLNPICPYLIKHEHKIWETREARKKQRKNRKYELEERYLIAVHKKGSDAIAVHTKAVPGVSDAISAGP